MEDSKYERLLDLILEIKDDVSELRVEAASNTVVLEEHAKRSTASENRHELLELRMEALEIKEHRLNGFWKISLGILGVVGTLSAITAAIHSLR
jgi:hypothetical protein